MRDLLNSVAGGVVEALGEPLRLRPIDQLVKSYISSRTKDEISARAFARLTECYPDWHAAIAADLSDLHEVLAEVTFPEMKAPGLVTLLKGLAGRQPDLDLSLLNDMPVHWAMAWLDRLPGVGIKIAASVLNFSCLNIPAFVVDTHVLRVLRRTGIVHATASTDRAYQVVMAATTDWTADELARFHDLIEMLGHALCRPRVAHCRACPLRTMCLGHTE